MAELKAITYKSEINLIGRYACDFESVETGGDLFGFWNQDGMPVVIFVTGPGKDSKHNIASFYQDIPYLHECGDYLHNNFALEHIGSWHSHHKMGIYGPSEGDLNTMRNCLNTQAPTRFLIVICNFESSKAVIVNGFIFSLEFQNIHKNTLWVLLPEISPIRDQVKDHAKFIKYPKTKKVQLKIQETNLNESKKVIPPEKVDLPVESYFNTSEGRIFLKKELEKIKERKDCTDVELVQNSDKTIGITFKFDGKDIEIRYPLDFSEKNPNPTLIEKNIKDQNKEIKLEVTPERMYFISPFDFFREIRRAFFDQNWF
jgi:hypothetical protein